MLCIEIQVSIVLVSFVQKSRVVKFWAFVFVDVFFFFLPYIKNDIQTPLPLTLGGTKGTVTARK